MAHFSQWHFIERYRSLSEGYLRNKLNYRLKMLHGTLFLHRQYQGAGPCIGRSLFYNCQRVTSRGLVYSSLVLLITTCVTVKRSTVDIRNRPRIPIPDEDPYSVAGNGGGSSGSSGGGGSMGTQQHVRRSDKPPKLPPRGDAPYPHDIPKVGDPSILENILPDYDDIEEDENRLGVKNFPSSRGTRDKTKDKKYDDPYYCGLRARVPNFTKSKEAKASIAAQMARYPMMPAPPPPSHPHHQLMWHARSYDSGMGMTLPLGLQSIYSEHLDSPYNHIYGRLPIPTRGYIPPTPRTMYIGEWD
ncbi:hypothetical protein J6590_030057 [Homalodisca vitripennis]|nr:hypothetical protein J6590_030057 [Homalodisca vitripennis]